MSSYKAFFASPYLDEHRWVRDRVAEACRKQEVGFVSVDEAVTPGEDIVSRIHQEVDQSDLAIAVLTDANPNVYYELGRLLQASKPTILLISDDQVGSLPFDVRSFAILVYSVSDPARLTAEVEAALARVVRALDPSTRSEEPSAQVARSGAVHSDTVDFQEIVRYVEESMKLHQCETNRIKKADHDSFRGWVMSLRCLPAVLVDVVIDLNGQVIDMIRR